MKTRPQSVHFNEDYCYLGRERLRSHWDEIDYSRSDQNLSNIKISPSGLLKQFSTSVRSLRKTSSTSTTNSTTSSKKQRNIFSKLMRSILGRNSCGSIKKPTKRRCSSSSMDFWEETYDLGK